jgi:hypothetical protein
MMRKMIKTILASSILLLASTAAAAAQDELTLFDKLERSIRENMPEWTLAYRAPNPNPKYKVIMYQWNAEGREISVWMTELSSPEKAARRFSELFGDEATEKVTLCDIGDKCYEWGGGSNDSGALAFRDANVIVRINAERIAEGPAHLLRRFAFFIAEEIPAV